MTIEEIQELIKLVNDTGVAELELQRGENRVRIRRAGVNHDFVLPHSGPAPPPAYIPTPAAMPASSPATAAAPAPALDAASDPALVIVKSPIVGTYYDAPSPGAPTFVREGEAVAIGRVLCIIESMKLMNEIEAEINGVIVSKLVENGRPVEYGEGLFAVRPA